MVLIMQFGSAEHEQSRMAYSVRPCGGAVRVRRGCREDPVGAPGDLREGLGHLSSVRGLFHEEAGQAEHDSLCAHGGRPTRAPTDLRRLATDYGPAMAVGRNNRGRAGLVGPYPTRVAVGGSVVLISAAGVFMLDTGD